MKLSLNWLKDYVDIDMSVEELAHVMTMAGLEVEGIEHLGQSLDGVVAAEILSVKKHPKADRLVLCEMDTGSGESTVVCGAPNVKKGQLVPMALPGTTLPGGITIKKSKIRGELSLGMLLAEDEMGLTDDHTGLMILHDDIKPGTPVSDVLPLEDYSIDISLTPNRPDCASVIGIAREIAALTGQKVRYPEIQVEEGNTSIEDLASVDIQDQEGCPRYAAGLIQGVELKQSPFWMRYRLSASGIRSINNVVDISNYVLLDTGQPLHTFDFDRVGKSQIIVKRAENGEKFTTLDGQERDLNNETLMICDGERSVALAGIMGGLNSEISEDSRDVLIESAYFDPITIRRGSKRLGLSTEASYRFERGMDIDGVITALKRAQVLILELAGGTCCKGIIDNYLKKYKPSIIDLRIKKTNDFLGTAISKEKMISFLKSLEMEVKDKNEDIIEVTPPSYRIDIEREIDLVEEVARLEGYDNIPVSYPAIRPSDESKLPLLLLRDRVFDIMTGIGFSETISYSFISPDSADLLGSEEDSHIRSFVNLKNPLSIDQSVMRTSLVPGLIGGLKTNINHGETDLKIFEWGKIFIKKSDDKLPLEKHFLSALITGLEKGKEWYNVERHLDFYDIKGLLEILFESLNLKDIKYKRGTLPAHYNPDISCNIYISDTLLGSMGQISSNVLDRYDIDAENSFLFELDVEELLNKVQEATLKFEPFAKFPAVYRDISIIVGQKVESEQIRNIIEKKGGELVEYVKLFDLYQDKKVGSDTKALSFRICYRSKESTLDGKDVNILHESVISAIMEETGGRLKEG